MPAMSTILRDDLIDHILRNTAYTSPTTIYVALYTDDPTVADTGTEVTGGSYARQTVAFGAPSSGATSSTGAVTFTNMPATTITHVALRDDLSAGNLLFFGALSTEITTTAGDTVTFALGQIIVQLL